MKHIQRFLETLFVRQYLYLPVFGIFRLREDTELLSAVRSTGSVTVSGLSPIDEDCPPAPGDEFEWWVDGFIDPVLSWFPLLFPFRSTIGEQAAAFPCCIDAEFALVVLEDFGLVFPCSLNASSFLTACGLAAPNSMKKSYNGHKSFGYFMNINIKGYY